ncbi:TPA: hypothetical protein ACX6RU_000633 [Photobacterium damselae]
MRLSQFLKEEVKDKKITQSKIVSQLNLFHEEFYNLDEITFSRWINGKTQPSRLRVLLLLLFFKKDIYEYLKKFDFKKKLDSEFQKAYKSQKKLLECDYHVLKKHEDRRFYKKEYLVLEPFISLLKEHYDDSAVLAQQIMTRNSRPSMLYSKSPKLEYMIDFFPILNFPKGSDMTDDTFLEIEAIPTACYKVLIPGYANTIDSFNRLYYMHIIELFELDSETIFNTKLISIVRDEKTREFLLLNGYVDHKISYIGAKRYYILIANCEDVLSSRYTIFLLDGG